MKRHRLAARRKAVGLSQEQLAEALGVDRSTVVRWERGDTAPQPWHRPRLAAALRISVDDLAALMAGPAEPPSSDAAWIPLTGARPQFRSAISPEIDDLAAVHTLRRADSQLGGGYFYASLTSYLQSVVGPRLIGLTRPSGEVFIAAAGLTEMAGWMAHDAGQDGRAARHFESALALTRSQPAHQLTAHIFGSLGHLAFHAGRPAQAVAYVQQGLSELRDTRAYPAVEARLLAMLARGSAVVGREADCTNQLLQAERTLGAKSHEERSPWINDFDEASFAAEAARCFQHLGRVNAARHQAEHVIAVRSPIRTRSRAFAQLTMMHVLLASGDPEAACALGAEVLDATGTLSSYLVIQQLEALADALAPFASGRSVVPFLERLREELRQRRWFAHWLPHAQPPPETV
jgi:transcriptional regulator with XRE-family HTH domain